jgi:hypothetical protein
MLNSPCDSEEIFVSTGQDSIISSFYDDTGKTFQELIEDITKVIISNIADNAWQDWR